MSTEIRTASGMRPTGPLHLGHYFGVLKNWVDLQDKLRAFFFVADWHALTTDFNRTEALRENTIEMVNDWIGCQASIPKSAPSSASPISRSTLSFPSCSP